MANRVYLSPSSQWANTYAAGDTNEGIVCGQIAVLTQQALERCGFETMTDTGRDSTMYKRAAQSDLWGADLHLCIHTNAFNGTMQGTRLYCLDLRGQGYAASREIYEELRAVVPGDSDSIQTARFYEILQTNAPCAYVEAAFHDNAEQALWIVSHKADIAEAICKGVCRYFGAFYVPRGAVYRVQVGAFLKKENAQALQKRLQELGFEAFITETKEENNG